MTGYFTSEYNAPFYLNYITTNHRDLNIKYTAQKINNISDYGINGTFFDGGNGNLTSIAIQNGNSIHDYGYYNRAYANNSQGQACGTFVVLENMSNSGRFLFVKSFIKFPVTIDGETIAQNQVRFAVGGCNLFLDQDLTQSQFEATYSSEDFPSPYSNAIRTAILYIGGTCNGGNTILLTVVGESNNNPGSYVGGPTAWELRQIIKQKWPNCIMGINLDGGGSTQIAYKNASGSREWIAPLESGSPRTVYSFVTVPM